MKRIKKFTSALLAMIIALSTFSAVSVSAAEIDQNIFVGSDFPDYGNSDYENDCIIFGDYEYRLLDDGTAEIVQYHGEDTQVAIPSEMDGYTVASIGDYAFIGCYSLESVVIPGNVEYIGEMAFGYYYDGEYDEDLLIDGFTIYGVKGSAAEQYANDNGIKFSQNLSAPQINKLENTTKGIKLGLCANNNLAQRWRRDTACRVHTKIALQFL